MNIELRDFQSESVNDLVKNLRKAMRDARDGELQAVSLASPTGSGKTVMLIETIERILEGDDQMPPQSDATFLWITDQPELNLQTRDKMLAFSTVLTPASLIVLDSEFDAEQFDTGVVYFLNTQKLGKKSLLVTPGDRRTSTAWETIENTVRARPETFFVIIDEAHRGMAQSAQAVNEANAIIQKFILGSQDEIPPIPLIVGVSATLRRFENFLGTKGRVKRAVSINALDVRASGLIKDAIQFTHPSERIPSDMTLLRAAVASWRDYQHHWAEYSASQGEPLVNPLLTVQVEDGTEKVVSKTDIAEAISCIEAEAGTLPERAFAHAFQEKMELEIAGRRIRYVAPSEISSDPDVQIVFFKTSLTTGWDCPRAEVMMSFRPAKDATNIAQLVGRMVRTPLARRIDVDEHLNTVALYLPHYDAKGLQEVVDKLTDPESGLAQTAEIRTEEVKALKRSSDTEEIFEALSRLPSYSVPRNQTPNEIKRLVKMGYRLSVDKLLPNASDFAEKLLLDVIDEAYDKVKNTTAYRQIVDERDNLDIRLVSYLFGEETTLDPGKPRQIPVSPENVEDLFEAAGRKIGEGLHREWRTRRGLNGQIDPRRAKLEFIALATADLKRQLSDVAKKQSHSWMTLYRDKIAKLPENKRQAYDEIQGLASEPEIASLVYPQVIEAKVEGEFWTHHLFTEDDGRFQAKFNEWETLVMREELKRGVRGWLRVVPRKSWALTIPYKSGNKIKPVYIDFIVIRNGENGLAVDIVDPHAPSLGDAADKLAGLANYAKQHGSNYGRIESIIVEDDEIRRLNLQDEEVRERACRVRTLSDVTSLFAEAAVSHPAI